MTRRLITAFALLLLGLTVGSVDRATAQPRLGGYREMTTDDSSAVAAAQFAVATRAEGDVAVTLVSIEKAERQIVAGQNFRLLLNVSLSNGEYEATQQVKAVVYRNLQGEYSVTSWEAVANEGEGSGE